jgi:Mn-containing catalase
MFSYQKRLLFPVYVEHPDEKFAQVLLEHFRGEDSEYAAYNRYLYYRLHTTTPLVRDLLGMIAAEELSHWEIIGVAIRKLSAADLPAFESYNNFTTGNTADTGIIPLLMAGQAAEERAKKLLLKHLSLTNDTYLKKMMRFLLDREDIHQKLLEKTITLLAQNAGNEQLASLIHEYKMSLRVIK